MIINPQLIFIALFLATTGCNNSTQTSNISQLDRLVKTGAVKAEVSVLGQSNLVDLTFSSDETKRLLHLFDQTNRVTQDNSFKKNKIGDIAITDLQNRILNLSIYSDGVISYEEYFFSLKSPIDFKTNLPK